LQPLSALPNCVFPHNSAPGQGFVPTATSANPLGFLSLSPAMIDFLRINATDVITYERNMVAANLTGDLFDLWGEGAVSMAVGVEYRNEVLDSRFDPSKTTGDIIGFNAAENIGGGFDVYEAYGEVKIPLITGETLFDNLSIEAGYRVSDYSTGAGITQTWKYGAEWSPWSWLTFRAIENHAVRAPSAFELFQAGDQNFPSAVDPCDKDTLTGGAAACTAWFAAFGAVWNPAFDQPNAQVQAFQFGNLNLTPEIADTLTYGVVFNPDWFPVGRIGLSVDRYEIELDNQIGRRSAQQNINLCRDAIIANGNVFPPGNAFCSLVFRDATSGGISGVNQSLSNFVGVSLYSGVDVNLRWSGELEALGLPGTLGIASLYTWTDESDGSVGFYVGGIGGVIAEHKAATNVTYSLDDLTFNLRWTYTGGVADGVFGPAVPDYPEYHMYDFGGQWQMTEEFRLSFGVENIFDKQPPLMPGAVAGGGQYNTDTSTYDPYGRQFRIGINWKN
jgi:iron complex outermembrane recepter protein